MSQYNVKPYSLLGFNRHLLKIRAVSQNESGHKDLMAS